MIRTKIQACWASLPSLLLAAGVALHLTFPPTLHASVPPSGISLNSSSVREFQPAGTIVGILTALDEDPADSHSFALVAGDGSADNTLFDISSDILRTATVLEYADRNRFRIRIRAQDASGETFEKSFSITVTPPSFVSGMMDYLRANPAVSNAAIATLDAETRDYFWVYQNALAETGRIEIDPPANTPADFAASGPSTIYLSTTETARILAAKTAHAIWLDRQEKVPWRLRDYDPAHLQGLFDKATVFNRQSDTLYYYFSVVDHSPTDAYQYAVQHGLVRENVFATIQAVFDDFRSDTLHGSSSYGDPTFAYTLRFALTNYSTTRFRPARISRSGCHSMSRILLGVLRSVNIPGYETRTGEYFLNLHSEAVFPCVARVLPHGDHIYSADLTATPADELMPTFQFFQDNLFTPPCAGIPYRVAVRHEAMKGTLYPTPTMLRGVRNPVLSGYTNAVDFLSGYAGWNQGLTEQELQQAADTMLTNFNETRRLTVPTDTPEGWVINNPGALDYVLGSRVSLKALPKHGYVFSHWTGDVPPGDETANPLVLTLANDAAIQALFIRPPVRVSIERTAEGESLISFTAEADVSYAVQYRDDLNSGAWETLIEIPARPAKGEVTSSDAEARSQRFYRIATTEESSP